MIEKKTFLNESWIVKPFENPSDFEFAKKLSQSDNIQISIQTMSYPYWGCAYITGKSSLQRHHLCSLLSKKVIHLLALGRV